MIFAALVSGKLATNIANIAADPVDLVLDLFKSLRKRAQTSLQPFYITCGGQVESAHRCVLGLERLLACAEGRGDCVLEHLAIEQRLGKLADRLLAARPQAVWVVVLH